MRQPDRSSNDEDKEQESGFLDSMFGKWFVGYFLVALIGLVVRLCEIQEEAEAKQEKLRKSVEEVRAAVRRGEAGEAFNRLFPDDYEHSLNNQRKD